MDTNTDKMPRCKICAKEAELFDQAKVLSKHTVKYYRCTDCGFVQTETPFWLEEAYTRAIGALDQGILWRNLGNRSITAAAINLLYPKVKTALDYGAGHGIFVRLMRDRGFDFAWYDLHATNDYAIGFEHRPGAKYDFMTCFEVFEHLVDPISEIQNMMDLAPSILFSTELVPQPAPKVSDWCYYAPQGGQHIAFYTRRSLQKIAHLFRRHLVSRGIYHLLTDNPKSSLLFRIATHPQASHLCGRRRGPGLDHGLW